MIVALAGIGAGALHVVSRPDHLAALAPFTARAPSQGAHLGACWGLGHGIGVLAMGALAHALAGSLDLHDTGIAAERAVGASLLALAARTLWRARHPQKAEHAHPRSGALAFGALHGAAGAAHLIALLPTLVLGALETAVYLVAAIATMGLVGALAGRLIGPRDRVRAQQACALLAGAVGAAWLVMG